MDERDITNMNVIPFIAVRMIEMLSKHLLPVELTVIGKYDKEEVKLRLSCNWEDISAKSWLINKATFLAQQRMQSYSPEEWDKIEDGHLAVLKDYLEKHPQFHA